jgi:GPH family glycoside/pentoside/hexuronide:cation symporter
VDKLQGNIRELRSNVQFWQNDQDLSKTNTSLLENTKKQLTQAINESRLYLTVLEKESGKKQEEAYQNKAEYKSQRKIRFSEVIADTRLTVGELENLNQQIVNFGRQTTDSSTKKIIAAAIPLILEPKLDKARMNSFELLSHLEGKSLETEKSVKHYAELIQNSTEVDKRLAKFNTNAPLDVLDKELNTIETEIVQLTKQSPYTLLMMRVVEIGLPLLLSIFSIFFILRYSLTEKRSHEIKELIKQRNLDRLTNLQ